ncbi:hypothetical protein JAAARDRAFT_49940 [Jaapia argillacea MUCL 33604]|uniref:Leucine-rich repeat-containing N-terminal plant-type domain-containing protein n=1 Tax=Jaapia argillacea MUCL 33604 TaxID=933084 RepID=A0A067PEK1_9AGAM|nr:hypothetical protein JAAARDRAFT_49940 [Jaapia argillacea MUCL 33604]
MSRIPQPQSGQTRYHAPLSIPVRSPSKSSSKSTATTSTRGSGTETPTPTTTRARSLVPPSPRPQARRAPTPSSTASKSPSPDPSPTTPSTPRTAPSTRVGTPNRLRLKSTPAKPPASTPKPSSRQQTIEENEPSSSKPHLSIREAIALKRAEAKKAQEAQAKLALDDGWGEGSNPNMLGKKGDDDIVELGRWSLREAIERSRSSGSINLSTRSLPCLPSALFEIHLGITPDPLPSVPNEPPLPPASPVRGRSGGGSGPSWYEAQDLEVIKAWNNEIVEIQKEIALFGSLQIVDLHTNHLSTLPSTFPDLTSLTTLDLSHNTLTTLPHNFFALPQLLHLNLSHNSLTSLPFNEPFDYSSPKGRGLNEGRYTRDDDFFTPAIVRAEEPLPKLQTLDVSFNQLRAGAIDLEHLPVGLVRVDLSGNPLEQLGKLELDLKVLSTSCLVLRSAVAHTDVWAVRPRHAVDIREASKCTQRLSRAPSNLSMLLRTSLIRAFTDGSTSINRRSCLTGSQAALQNFAFSVENTLLGFIALG